MVVGIPVTLVDNCILQCVITTTSVGGSLKYYNGFVQKWHISGKPLVNHHMSRWIDTFGVYTLFSDIPKICHCFPIQQITNKQQLSAWLYRVTYWWQKYATENWWHMSIEYLENRRNLPSDGVMLLAMKQDRHQNGMPTVCVCVDTCGNIWSQRLALFPRNLYRNALETAVLSAVFPDGAPQSKGKIRKRQRNPLKGWKLQLIRNLAEAAQSKGKLWKLQRKIEKISHVPSACM